MTVQLPLPLPDEWPPEVMFTIVYAGVAKPTISLIADAPHEDYYLGQLRKLARVAQVATEMREERKEKRV